jgi:cytidine deaminase
MEKDFDRGELIRKALEQQKKAYAPYSRFYVGAAVLMDSGKIYTGANVENASFPAGVCAERNAIYHAAACGERKIRAIAIVGGSKGDNLDYAAPCGICRQVMREFSDPKEMTVLLAKTPEDYREMKLEDLLPMGFGPENLPSPPSS